MSEAPQPDSAEGAVPWTRKWVAWREAVRRAAAEDQARVEAERDQRQRQFEQDYRSPATFIAGLLVLALLLGLCWLIFDQLRCDPYFSDSGLSHSRSCR